MKRLDFTYIFCNNLARMEAFYSNILHLDLIYHDRQSIAYNINGHQLSIFQRDDFSPFPAVFSQQPGWAGGAQAQISWSLACDKEDFLQIVSSIQENTSITAYHAQPVWEGYWSFPVLDPMNHTIEITCTDR